MVSVRTLGTAQIDAGELRITPASTRKFALLLRLAAEPGRRVQRAVLRDFIFPDLPEHNARHSLRDLVYQFRQAGVAIDSDTASVALVAHDVSLDYAELIRAAEPSLELLRAAQGGLLPGYAPEHSEAFTEWLAAFRARVTLQVCRSLAATITRAKLVGNWLTTEHAARACLGLEPTHEEATLALAETLAVSGSKAQALRLLDEYVRDLGPARSQLQVPALVVRRRISERLRENYRRDLTLPFLGRDEEMLMLHERFELARSGESQCVVIVGDAGIGKSRLAEEFCTQAVLQGARAEQIATQPHDAHRPMAAFADLVPKLLQLPGALGCSPESLAALKLLTGHEAEKGPQDGTDSETVAAAMFRAIADLIDAITAETPLVLRIDDIQWSDELSMRALISLTSGKVRRRLLALLTSRDRSSHRTLAQRADRVVGLPLHPLGHGPLSQILKQLLATDQSEDKELIAWMATTSGGNPFFLRCLLAHYQSTGERFSVPATLNTLLDQLIASLSDNARALLEMCVTLARHASFALVMKALDLPYAAFQEAVRELELSNLISGGGARIAAVHWLVAEAVHRASTPIAHQLRHRRVAELLEADARRTGASAELWDCAEHWILAGENARAVQVMRTCAQHSLAIGRPREAAEILVRAASLSAGPEAIELANEAAQTADDAGETDLYRRAAALAKSHGGSISYEGHQISDARIRLAELDYGPELRQQLLAWVQSDLGLRYRIKAGITALMCADQDDDIALGKRIFTILSPLVAERLAIDDLQALRFFTIYHSSFGTREDSVRFATHLLQVAEELELATAASLQRFAGVALMRAGHARRAQDAFRIAYSNARQSGLVRLQVAIACMLAGSLFDSGCDAESEEWLNLGRSLTERMDDRRVVLIYLFQVADFECTRGRLAAARDAIAAIRSGFPDTPSPTFSRWMKALETRIRHLSGERLDASFVLHDLTSQHRVGSEHGDLSDFELGVALDVLCDAGLEHDGRRALADYVRYYRRSYGQLSRILANGARRLGMLTEDTFDDTYTDVVSRVELLNEPQTPDGVA